MPYPLPDATDFLSRSRGAPLRVLAEHYGVSPSTCHNWRVRFCCTPGRHVPHQYPRSAEAQTLAVLAAHPEGCTAAWLARDRGVSRQRIHQILQALLQRSAITADRRGPVIVFHCS